MFHFAVALLSLSTAPDARPAAGTGVARQPAATPGCYRADRPFGTSAGSIRGRAVPGFVGHQIGEDSAGLTRFTTFRLLAGGRADRPGTVGAGWWAHGSRWARAGDSLQVRLSTGTAGWALQLVATPAGSDSAFVGVARYLSDAVVRRTADTAWRDAPRSVVHVVHAVRVWREPCAAAAQRGG